VRICVERCRGICKVEVSGGIRLETVAHYADTGADAISVGALTHSVTAIDFGLDWEET
jgi:nicotinate-nucleotide pyrophosphorylase (carboxylating)